MTNENWKCCYLRTMKKEFILAVSVLLAAAGPATAATNDLPTFLQRGLFEEEANHQLDAAIGNYKEAIEHFDHERQLAATAIFRLGECYRKLGRTNEAAVQYQRIVREFDDQKELVTLSRQNLTGMGISAAPGFSSLPDAARQKQEKLLEEEIKVVEQESQLQQTQFKTGLLSEGEILATQQKLLELKRQLAALEGDQPVSPSSIAASPTEASLLPSDEEKFLREIQESVQNSPDLVNQQLLDAVQKSYVSAAEYLLAHGADVNTRSSGDQSTPIVEAAKRGNEAMVQLLLNHGAAVNSQNRNGNTALSMAVDLGYMAVCRTLLDHGADVTSRSILAAAGKGKDELVQLLLSHGASVNSPGYKGQTPLFQAAENGSIPVCQTLVAHGADVNAKDADGLTPLHVAVEHDHSLAAEFLITNKAQIDAKSNSGETPLLVAIIRKNVNLAKVLLDHHADANMESSIGPRTGWWLCPLAWAIYLNDSDMAKALLEGHADPNAVISSLPSEMTRTMTPDWWDMRNRLGGDRDLPQELAQKWDPPIRGETPLLWDLRGNPPMSDSIVKLLLEHGANPNTSDADGDIPLKYAMRHLNIEMVQLLIERGADVNALNKQGNPPLANLNPPFSETGSQIRQLLIKAGADPDYRRRSGIWMEDVSFEKAPVFWCPTNSISHYTLFDFLAAIYGLHNYRPDTGTSGGPPFPDFARVVIHRLQGRRDEELRVNVADFFQTGDCSKNTALQPGDVVEIPEKEHNVSAQWWGLSTAETISLNTCLLRTVQIAVKGKTNTFALVASPAYAGAPLVIPYYSDVGILMYSESANHPDWLVKALKGRKVDAIVGSFNLNSVVRSSKMLLNTSDLSRVRLRRGSAKMMFDLTANSQPVVWLADGDVIEIPELGEVAPATETK
jgi:ankyrin repeat protein